MGILDAPNRTPAERYTRVPTSLFVLDRALSQRQYRRANIVAVGDSLLEGVNGSTYRGSLVPSLQDALRGLYPTPGQGGGGFSGGLDTVGSAWSITGSLGPQDCIPTTTGTATSVTGATTNLGLGRRLLQLTPGATATFPAVRCTGFDIETMGASASTVNFTWSVDGGAATTASTAATRTTLSAAVTAGATVLPVTTVPADWSAGVQVQLDLSGTQETVYIASINTLNVTITTALVNSHASGATLAANGNGGYFTAVRGLTEGLHTLVITAVQNVTLLGVDYFLNDENSGIHVYNAGHAGIRADQLLSTGAIDHWTQSVVVRKPDAIFCDLIINDSGAQTPATMITNLTALRTRINNELAARYVPIPTWVHTIPYQIYSSPLQFQGNPWTAYVAAIHAWANADTSGPGNQSGIFVLDGSRLMPRGDAVATGYFHTDAVHPLTLGSQTLAGRWAQALPLNGVLV